MTIDNFTREEMDYFVTFGIHPNVCVMSDVDRCELLLNGSLRFGAGWPIEFALFSQETYNRNCLCVIDNVLVLVGETDKPVFSACLDLPKWPKAYDYQLRPDLGSPFPPRPYLLPPERP